MKRHSFTPPRLLNSVVVQLAALGRAVDVFNGRWAHIARVFLAAGLALWLAFWLQLDTPYSAATTVFLVAHPIQGITLSKGVWRIIGSVLGAVVAVVLIALFAQAPSLFIFGFAVWLGVCVAIAGLLRHFRGYGAVVAGYTIGLVIYGAIDTPELIFDHAVGRVSVVALGVVALGITTALLSRRDTHRKLDQRLLNITAAIGRLAADDVSRRPGYSDTSLIAKRHALVSDIHGLDDLLEFSSAEKAEVAQRAGTVRYAMAALFAVLVGIGRANFAAAAGDSVAEARATAQSAFNKAAQILEAGPGGEVDALRTIGCLRQRIISLRAIAEEQAASSPETASIRSAHESFLKDLIAFDRLDELVEEYETAIKALLRFRRPRPSSSSMRFRFHLDVRGAIDNGVRAVLAVLCAGAFWIASAWSFAPLMILLIAPFCGLLALTPNPVLASVEFIKGIIVAALAGFVCTFGILPHVSGYPLLIAAFAPFWIIGIYATTNPKTGPAGTAYLLTFMTLVGPTNPMLYDVERYLNSALAFILSGFCTLLSFRLFFPRMPALEAIRFEEVIREETRAVLARTPKLQRHAFEHLQHQRLARLALLTKGNPERLNQLLSDGFVMLHLSRAVLRIREALQMNSVPTIVRFFAWHGLEDLRRHWNNPKALASVAHFTADRLGKLDLGEPSAVKAALHMASTYSDIAALCESNSDLFLKSAK